MLHTAQDTDLVDKIGEVCKGQPCLRSGRLFAPEEFFGRLKPFLEAFGITRLADVTGLDRLGIPVVQAIRPLALSNAVNQGKGLSLAEAAVSAAVEALETQASESLEPLFCQTLSPAEVFGAGAAALECHLVPDPPDRWQDTHIPFLKGFDPLCESLVNIPAALVGTDYTPTSRHAAGPFRRTTTGLGGGASLEEAVFHGFFEVLERLSTDRAMTTHGFFERSRIKTEGVADVRTHELIARVEAAGLLVAAFECPPAGPFPVAWVRLLDDRNTPTSLPYPSDGFACRETMAAALKAAFLEAVQTRAAVIAGGREDITRRYYPKTRDDALIDFERRQLRAAAGRLPEFSGNGGSANVPAFLNTLSGQDRRAIIVPVLARKDIPLFIVRVVPLLATGGDDDC